MYMILYKIYILHIKGVKAGSSVGQSEIAVVETCLCSTCTAVPVWNKSDSGEVLILLMRC